MGLVGEVLTHSHMSMSLAMTIHNIYIYCNIQYIYIHIYSISQRKHQDASSISQTRHSCPRVETTKVYAWDVMFLVLFSSLPGDLRVFTLLCSRPHGPNRVFLALAVCSSPSGCTRCTQYTSWNVTPCHVVRHDVGHAFEALQHPLPHIPRSLPVSSDRSGPKVCTFDLHPSAGRHSRPEGPCLVCRVSHIYEP